MAKESLTLRENLRLRFCRHDYDKIGFRVAEDRYERYSLRHYKCSKCGKEIWVDGRRDPYQR